MRRLAQVFRTCRWRHAKHQRLVHNIVQKIGYPTKSPDIRKPQQLRKYYANVSISAGDHFINVLSVQRDASEREWKKAEKPVDREEWGMTA